ncbi:hypothetical protein protein [Bacillus cereus G9241]|nr:hypothetical protein protein [Bacillus cereus G9241]
MFVRFPSKNPTWTFRRDFFLYIRFINQYCVMAKYSRIFDGMTIRFGVSAGRPSNCNPCLAAIFFALNMWKSFVTIIPFFILSGIKGFENLIFSSVLVDLSSIIMRSSAIFSFINSFFIANASEISSPFPFPPDTIAIAFSCDFKYSAALSIRYCNEYDGFVPFTFEPNTIM